MIEPQWTDYIGAWLMLACLLGVAVGYILFELGRNEPGYDGNCQQGRGKCNCRDVFVDSEQTSRENGTG